MPENLAYILARANAPGYERIRVFGGTPTYPTRKWKPDDLAPFVGTKCAYMFQKITPFKPGSGYSVIYEIDGFAANWIGNSTIAMLKEHDDRIRRAGGIPNMLWNNARQERAFVYYATSLLQYCTDEIEGDFIEHDSGRIAKKRCDAYGGDFRHEVANEPPLRPYPPEEIEQLKFADNLADQKAIDQRVIDLGALTSLTDRELVEISRILPTDPIATNLLQSIIDQTFPKSGGEFAAQFPGIDPALYAELSAVLTPEPTDVLTHLDPTAPRHIIKDPSLPVQSGNIVGVEDGAGVIAEDLKSLEHEQPGNYREAARETSDYLQAMETLNYWRAHYPAIGIDAAENPEIEPVLLTHQWRAEWGPAPLVNVWVLPRQKPKPDLGIFGEIFGSPWAALINVIPYVGAVLYTIGSAAGQADIQQWIRDHDIPQDVFEPQYEPIRFTVPFPLDWAQVAVRRPEYFPAMFKRFQADIRANKFETASQAWQSLSEEKMPTLPNWMTPGALFAPTGQRSGLIAGPIDNPPGAPFGSTVKQAPNAKAPASGAGALALIGAAAYLLS